MIETSNVEERRDYQSEASVEEYIYRQTELTCFRDQLSVLEPSWKNPGNGPEGGFYTRYYRDIVDQEGLVVSESRRHTSPVRESEKKEGDRRKAAARERRWLGVKRCL